MSESRTIMEFRCNKHIVRMHLEKSGAYSIAVTVTGLTFCDGSPLPDNTFSVAEVVDKDLAIHCFNHTVEQYQKEAL